jgi:hypothetical protein
MFMDGHPQRTTHRIQMRDETKANIPNMIPALPRGDKGDRQFYCCSMLTLFKPWRDGLDLKSRDKEWDQAYDDYEFSERQKELMSFFNIKYECHDARDDFRLQRLAMEKGASLPSWCNQETIEHFDTEDHMESILKHIDDGDGLDEVPEEYQIISKQTANKNRELAEMTDILKNSGWLDASVDGTSYEPPEKYKLPLNTIKHWSDLLTNKKKEMLAEKMKSMGKKKTDENGNEVNWDDFEENQVVIANEDYLKISAKMKTKDKKLIQHISDYNTLNEEQERAFNIIAAHSINQNSAQLSMYLGGMAGTGKSQVIKSLIYLFHARNEEYRFVVLAPTGSAAALVKGSTYHSVLGIRDNSGDEQLSKKSLNQIRDRLSGIQYIFIDEVSMMSCQDMYRISARLARTKGNIQDPFGGVNMIFAGDFAQLPPAMNSAPLYSGNVRNRIDNATTIKGQENAIGKALWHQVTTVVILKENMRQKSQTPEDAKLRQCLDNMRYRACTDEDIKFLNTLVAGRNETRKSLNQKRFRDVSVITGLNIHRDSLNGAGVERFAEDTNQTLEIFYSIDKAVVVDPSKSRRTKGSGKSVTQLPVSAFEQNILWNLPPSLSEQHAGKLQLCKGMPVMIKKNEATECCVTNGAEATVYDWNYTTLLDDRKVLTVLFVKLKNPPQNVKLDGLPENVVPLKRSGLTINCSMPNGKLKRFYREQVCVLINFGMSDYASQGRTRPDNVVDLNNCKTHQSYYTVLSRSASAEGTIILQSFDSNKIQNSSKLSLKETW